MKKTFLTILSLVCLCSAVAFASDSTTTTSTVAPDFEKMGPPQGNFGNPPAGEPKGSPKAGQVPNQKPNAKPPQKPNKKPDAKPGGDRVPPEFQHSNSSTTTTSK